MLSTKVSRPGLGRAFAATAMAFLALISQASVATAQDETGHVPSVYTFSGSDWAQDSNSYYFGALISLQRNFNKDGFVLRLLGQLGDYEFDEITVPGGRVDGDVVGGDVMIGYQFTRGFVTATIYIGVDYLDYDLSPDVPTEEIRGDEVGFKVAGDLETSTDTPLFVGLSGSYSTAFDTYYAQLRVGYNSKHFAIGPEGAVAGDESGDIQRLGGFATFRFNLTPINESEFTIYAGHQFSDDGGGGPNSSGGEGAYGGVSYSVSF